MPGFTGSNNMIIEMSRVLVPNMSKFQYEQNMQALSATALRLNPSPVELAITLKYCEDLRWKNVAADIQSNIGTQTPPFAPGVMYVIRGYLKCRRESWCMLGGAYRQRVEDRCLALWGVQQRAEVIGLLAQVMLGDVQAVRRRLNGCTLAFTAHEIEFVISGHGYEGVAEPIVKWLRKYMSAHLRACEHVPTCAQASAPAPTLAPTHAHAQAHAQVQTHTCTQSCPHAGSHTSQFTPIYIYVQAPAHAPVATPASTQALAYAPDASSYQFGLFDAAELGSFCHLKLKCTLC